MPRFPYMNFPFPFYKSYPRAPSNFYNFVNNAHGVASITPALNNSSVNANSSIYDSDRGFGHKNKSNKNNDDFLFDLFGLKIYNDDVLLVSLIYFLYSEGVKDDGLFLALILLLLS